MRILYHFRTRGSGAEAVHISGIANALERLGHEVVFFSPAGRDPRAKTNPYAALKAPGFFGRVSRALPRFVFELLEIAYNGWALLKLRGLLGGRGFDLIYERHAFFLIITAFLALDRGLPLVVEVNELVGDARVSDQPALGWLVQWCDRFVFERATSIIVVSPHLKRRIEALGIPGDRILVQPNAVDPQDFAELVDGATVRQRHGLGDAVVVGFVGWFVEWHRVELLVEAFAALVARQPKGRLLLVAEGPLRETLEAQVRRLGVLDRVCFAGSAPHAEIPAHMAAMDICVVPHSNEYRSPIKLFEYLGQGRAVVAPRTEPIEMVVRDGENGLLFSPGSAAELTEALERLTASAELRRKLGTQARVDVLSCHTWTHNAEAMLAHAKVHVNVP